MDLEKSGNIEKKKNIHGEAKKGGSFLIFLRKRWGLSQIGG